MADGQQSVLVTGVAGNLGVRLLPELAGYAVIGVDLNPPAGHALAGFEQMDLGEEASCRQLLCLIRERRPFAVIHLAFVIDPVRTGVLDVNRMWHINVAGTARVMEAITVANRENPIVRRLIVPGSVSAYGSDLPGAVKEDFPLAGHTLTYAIHKREADQVVQKRAHALQDCSTFLLRPHIFTGASVENYMVGAFRGTPSGRGKLAARLRARGQRLPVMFPWGRRYLDHRIQFVHVDDMARLIAWLLRQPESPPPLTILNVAGRGEAMTFRQCVRMSGARLLRLPDKASCKTVLSWLWKLGVSAIPPDALPYMTGEYIMNTERLQQLLGDDYERVIQHTVEEAFADGLRPVALQPAQSRLSGHPAAEEGNSGQD